MLHDLNWQTLQNRREVNRVTLLHKALRDEIALELPADIVQCHRTMGEKQAKLLRPFAKTNYYKFSFFPITVNDYNNLPDSFKSLKTDEFKTEVSKYKSNILN